MSSKKTKHQKLKELHYKAISLMLEGNQDSQIAKELDVAPETISRWKNHRPAFMAELERQRSEVLNILHDKQVELAFKALQIVEENMFDYGNKSALEFLKIFNKEVLTKANSKEKEDVDSTNIKGDAEKIKEQA